MITLDNTLWPRRNVSLSETVGIKSTGSTSYNVPVSQELVKATAETIYCIIWLRSDRTVQKKWTKLTFHFATRWIFAR